MRWRFRRFSLSTHADFRMGDLRDKPRRPGGLKPALAVSDDAEVFAVPLLERLDEIKRADGADGHVPEVRGVRCLVLRVVVGIVPEFRADAVIVGLRLAEFDPVRVHVEIDRAFHSVRDRLLAHAVCLEMHLGGQGFRGGAARDEQVACHPARPDA